MSTPVEMRMGGRSPGHSRWRAGVHFPSRLRGLLDCGEPTPSGGRHAHWEPPDPGCAASPSRSGAGVQSTDGSHGEELCGGRHPYGDPTWPWTGCARACCRGPGPAGWSISQCAWWCWQRRNGETSPREGTPTWARIWRVWTLGGAGEGNGDSRRCDSDAISTGGGFSLRTLREGIVFPSNRDGPETGRGVSSPVK